MKNSKWFPRFWMGSVYVFLYLPILVLIIFSFNEGRPTRWNGFTLENYADLFSNTQVIDGLFVSLRIAAVTAVLSVILGTLIAFVLVRYHRFWGKTLFSGIASTPLVMPEVVLGLSLLIVFKDLFHVSGGSYWTIILGHTLLGAAYASVVIKARLSELSTTFEEAALDLGAKPLQVFYLVTLPMIAQSLVAAALLVFTISFDDVVIAEFLKGPGVQTLPNVIMNYSRQGTKPVVVALGAMIVFVVSIFLISGSIWLQKREKRRQEEIAAAYREAA